MYAVNVTSPVQLPLVSGCRNSGANPSKETEIVSDPDAGSVLSFKCDQCNYTNSSEKEPSGNPLGFALEISLVLRLYFTVYPSSLFIIQIKYACVIFFFFLPPTARHRARLELKTVGCSWPETCSQARYRLLQGWTNKQ